MTTQKRTNPTVIATTGLLCPKDSHGRDRDCRRPTGLEKLNLEPGWVRLWVDTLDPSWVMQKSSFWHIPRECLQLANHLAKLAASLL